MKSRVTPRQTTREGESLRSGAKARERAERSTQGKELDFNIPGGGNNETYAHTLGYPPTRFLVERLDAGNGPLILLEATRESVTFVNSGTVLARGIVRVW
jgi:hypothetical protein